MRDHSGVIFAAGRGSRLADAINKRPKCLAEVGGQPLIDHQLALFPEAGVQRILIVTGYRAGEVGSQRANAAFMHNDAWEKTNRLYSFGFFPSTKVFPFAMSLSKGERTELALATAESQEVRHRLSRF